MPLSVKRSEIEPDYLEVWEEGQRVEEILTPFRIWKIPREFDSREQVHKWLQETEFKSARNSAYRLISMRGYSSTALKKKLEQKRFSPEICERILDELKRLGYLQDETLAENEILREFKRGYGPRYIELKLRSKGLNGQKIRTLITSDMEQEKIRELIQKSRFPKEKMIRVLVRRGFDLHLILKNFLPTR